MVQTPVHPSEERVAAPERDRRRPPGNAPPVVPLIVHVIHRLDYGGMENGLVNLINRTPPDRARHAIVCLTGYTDFRDRIRNPDVPVLALGKRDGKDVAAYWRLWRVLRRLAPDIVHTRNLPAVDMVVPAALARVPVRIHGEHGRDVTELVGGQRKYRAIRRAVSPLVDRYIPLSRELETWLAEEIGVPRAKITRIYNGVDVARFHPAEPARAPLPDAAFASPDAPGIAVIGTVGRMATVKNQPLLARAFAALAARLDAMAGRTGGPRTEEYVFAERHVAALDRDFQRVDLRCPLGIVGAGPSDELSGRIPHRGGILGQHIPQSRARDAL